MNSEYGLQIHFWRLQFIFPLLSPSKEHQSILLARALVSNGQASDKSRIIHTSSQFINPGQDTKKKE
jgi:hypothetical protein